jgi:hypothetical protein
MKYLTTQQAQQQLSNPCTNDAKQSENRKLTKLHKPRYYVIPADEHQSLICIGPCKLKSDAQKLMRKAKLSPEKWKVVKLMECTETLSTTLLGDKA